MSGGAETKGAGETVSAVRENVTENAPEEAGAKPPGDGQEPETLPEGQLAVYFLDVGQADCILLETQGRYMLIDAGSRDDFESIDAFLKEKGVERLDLVWFTHPHEDHIGSGAALLEAYEVGCVFLRTEAADTAAYANLEEVIQRKAIPRVVPEAGGPVGGQPHSGAGAASGFRQSQQQLCDLEGDIREDPVFIYRRRRAGGRTGLVK